MARITASRWRRWELVAVAALLAVFVLLVIDPSGSLLFRIIGLIGTALFALSVVVLLLTFRRARKILPLMLSVSIGISALCLTVYSLILNVAIPIGMWLLTLVAGGTLGVSWSLTNAIQQRPHPLRDRRDACGEHRFGARQQRRPHCQLLPGPQQDLAEGRSDNRPNTVLMNGAEPWPIAAIAALN